MKEENYKTKSTQKTVSPGKKDKFPGELPKGLLMPEKLALAIKKIGGVKTPKIAAD